MCLLGPNVLFRVRRSVGFNATIFVTRVDRFQV